MWLDLFGSEPFILVVVVEEPTSAGFELAASEPVDEKIPGIRLIGIIKQDKKPKTIGVRAHKSTWCMQHRLN